MCKPKRVFFCSFLFVHCSNVYCIHTTHYTLHTPHYTLHVYIYFGAECMQVCLDTVKAHSDLVSVDGDLFVSIKDNYVVTRSSLYSTHAHADAHENGDAVAGGKDSSSSSSSRGGGDLSANELDETRSAGLQSTGLGSKLGQGLGSKLGRGSGSKFGQGSGQGDPKRWMGWELEAFEAEEGSCREGVISHFQVRE